MSSVLFAVAMSQRRSESRRVARWLTHFGNYTTGVQPNDWRKVRSGGDDRFAQTIVVDGTFLGGKKMQLQGSAAASRLTEFTPANLVDAGSGAQQEVVVQLRAGLTPAPVGATGVGGAFVGATLNDDGGNNEYVARQHYTGSAWEVEFLQALNGSFGVPANAGNIAFAGKGIALGDKFILRLRYDKKDTTRGADGTVSLKVWKTGTAEPSSWDTTGSINAGVPAGACGCYGNDTAYRAEYEWFGASTDGSSAPSPLDANVIAYHEPTNIVADLVPLVGYEVFDDFAAGTDGVAPAGWTKAYELGTTYLVHDVIGASAGKVLQSKASGTRGMLYNDSVGLTNADREVLAKLRYNGLSTYTGGLAVRIKNNNSAVCLNLEADGKLNITFFKNTGFSQRSGVWAMRTIPTAGEWLHARLRAKGTRFKAKMWRPSELEPVEWHHNFTDADANINTGGHGAYNYEVSGTNGLEYDWLAIRPAA